MKIIKQIQCPECRTWIKYEDETEIKTKPRNAIELFVILYDRQGYESANLELILDINDYIDFEKLKKRQKQLDRIALDYARLQGYKATYAYVTKIEKL